MILNSESAYKIKYRNEKRLLTSAFLLYRFKTDMFRFIIFTFLLLKSSFGCDPNPCVYGRCTTDTDDGSSTKCICDDNWTGIHCNLPQPEVLCRNKTIDIFIDERIVTEQGLSSSPDFIHFLNAPECKAVSTSGGYYLKINAPFKECGVEITHTGDDYVFQQQVVWNQLGETIERPLVLLDFKCTYQDKYIVSFGEITPYVTTVDFETSYGTFRVDMNLYKSSSFAEEDRYGARPVVAIEDQVCVSTELQNVMPQDLVLTNKECWASTKRDGSGDAHYLVSEKCKDDPTTDILSNGEGDFARFCFQMFKWKDSMEEIYMHCIVNVCNATAYPDYCTCENGVTGRFARSLSMDEDGTRITFGPVYVKEAGWDDNELENNVISFGNEKIYVNPEDRKRDNERTDSKTTILIAVGVVLVIALILLGVVVAVYINCRRRSRDTKTHLRSEGEPVVIPNPVIHNEMMN
uniref:alpha-tectorin-like n=1 Tax=Styela clava TaxID=7725 RepID=UPI00193A804A|nr:alpha-tectorin-like [Styela clava]